MKMGLKSVMLKTLDHPRENKGKWFGMMYLLGAIWRLLIHPAKFENFKDEKKKSEIACHQ